MARDLANELRADLARGRNVMLVSGYARLPDAVASHAQYERIGVVLVVDIDSGEIIAAEPTLLTEVAKEFFRALTEGKRIFDDPAALIDGIERHYHGGSGPALISALRKALEALVTLRTNS
jgi:hypothetical protein